MNPCPVRAENAPRVGARILRNTDFQEVQLYRGAKLLGIIGGLLENSPNVSLLFLDNSLKADGSLQEKEKRMIYGVPYGWPLPYAEEMTYLGTATESTGTVRHYFERVIK